MHALRIDCWNSSHACDEDASAIVEPMAKVNRQQTASRRRFMECSPLRRRLGRRVRSLYVEVMARIVAPKRASRSKTFELLVAVAPGTTERLCWSGLAATREVAPAPCSRHQD